MSASEPIGPGGPDDPMDELDITILAGVRDLWETADPVPASLGDRIRFAIELADLDLDAGLWRLTELAGAAAARGDERTRTITLDSESLTIMINVVPHDDGTYRLDGWLAPPASHPIELRTDERTLATESDVRGRFAFDAVAAHVVQLVVRPSASRTVTTPTFSL